MSALSFLLLPRLHGLFACYGFLIRVNRSLAHCSIARGRPARSIGHPPLLIAAVYSSVVVLMATLPLA
ncbi:hypothetical protein BD414DRAFT_482622 [Trametes punicea]|nr:hypothetical protein BD414DRAFT_482622 [Trametes punicea]